MYIGRRIIYRENVSSTNDLAESLLRSGEAEHGTIIYAGLQTEGRGQKGKKWESTAGMNLTMSLILRPYFLAPERQFLISKIISLSIADLLKSHIGNITIKWPNDIYSGGDKIAGILIEHSIIGSIIESTFAGIGLNVNQEKFESDAPNPISMKMISGNQHEIKGLIKELSNHLNYWYTRLVDGDYTTIDNEYISLLYQLGKPAVYTVSGVNIIGTIKGVDPYGHLLLEDEGGAVRTFAFNEISFTL